MRMQRIVLSGPPEWGRGAVGWGWVEQMMGCGVRGEGGVGVCEGAVSWGLRRLPQGLNLRGNGTRMKTAHRHHSSALLPTPHPCPGERSHNADHGGKALCQDVQPSGWAVLPGDSTPGCPGGWGPQHPGAQAKFGSPDLANKSIGC